MRVAVVVTEIGREVGGRFTFQEMVLEALDSQAGDAQHEFSTYQAGISRYTEGDALWRAGRIASVAGTLAIQAFRDAQDRWIGKRLIHPRTGLQRRLDDDGIQLVWFPTTYVEDIDTPYVCTIFDVEHRLKPWFPEVSARGEFERRERYLNRYLPKATRVIVPNQAGLEQVQRFYRIPRENCLVLGHPTPGFALRAAEEPRRHDGVLRRHGIRQPFLVYPAQLWPHKNHAAALDALIELRDRGEQLSLVCVGSDKGQLDHVRTSVEARGLEQFVHLLGFVEEEELVALYQHAHALLYLSLFGPENLPPLEALALGCPAVVAEVPGAREQFGDTVLLVDAARPPGVADAVQRLSDPAWRARLVDAGRSRAAAWTAKDYVGAFIDFLDDFERERRLWD